MDVGPVGAVGLRGIRHYIRGIVEEVAANAESGHDFLVKLEAVLSERREPYEPRGEYSSDLGRLGSFASDIKGMLKRTR